MGNKLTEIYIMDLQKPEIDRFERAAIINDYIKQEGLSIRSFAMRFNLSKSTVEDWLLWNKIEKKEYETLKSKGLNHTQIYRRLRDNKGKQIDEILDTCELDEYLTVIQAQLTHYLKKITITTKTESKLLEIRDLINRLLMKIERNEAEFKP